MSFTAFKDQMAQSTRPEDYPLAAQIMKNIPIYDGDILRGADTAGQATLKAEFAQSFQNGPGIIVIKRAVQDGAIVDRATAVFDQIIEDQKVGTGGGGDHFAKPGSNDRIWNALEKHCLADPQNFIEYYDTPAISLPSLAWLGPRYQITAQVNRVNPGGAAQVPHRDYHLGFLGAKAAAEYPIHIHLMSPQLTLQGGLAHCDMPVESGPTVLLPYSQTWAEGYLDFGKPAYQDYFAKNYVQLPLEKGDALFFNPAVMHGAGDNKSKDIYRFVNLFQVGSAFGRSIETVDRTKMVKALYPLLKTKQLDAAALERVIAASAEGYAFPTNLDLDLPVGGLAPPSQADRMRQALAEGTTVSEFNALMDSYDSSRVS